jgi:periplasmic protein TonB
MRISTKLSALFIGFVFSCLAAPSAMAQSNCEQLAGTQKEECIRQKNLERQRRIAAARRAAEVRDSLAQVQNRLAATPPPTTAPVTAPPTETAPPPPLVVVPTVRIDDTPPTPLPTTVTPPATNATETAPPTLSIVPTESPVLDAAEEMPTPIGGSRGINNRIVYPSMAKRLGIQGAVFVQMVIDEQGKASDFVILKGLQGGCNEEAIRVLQETQFLPGKQDGKAVKVRLSVSVRFQLN